jgi:hypothetical protein
VIGIGVVAAAVVAVIVFLFPKGPLRPEDILAGMQDGAPYSGLTVRYPLDETVFPPEIVPPTFRWEDGQSGSDAWLVTIAFQDEEGPLHFLSLAPEWTPDAGDWEAIKKRSLERAATVTVVGVNRSAPGRILSGGRVTMSTSKDEVGAPLFYREVNLPFIDAVKDPSHIRWRFGAISSPRPPVVLENLPVCGNCHSFCAKGETLAMDMERLREGRRGTDVRPSLPDLPGRQRCGQHRKGQVGLRPETGSGVLSTVFSDQRHSVYIQQADKYLPAAAGSR